MAVTDKATGTAKKATGTATKAASAAGSTIGLGQGAERLKEEAQNYLGAQAQHALTSLGTKLGDMTNRLNDPGGSGSILLDSGKKLAEGKSPGRAVASAGAKGLKDKIKGAFQKLTGGARSGGPKVTNIVEDIDVGVPVREAYNQWTQYQEFSTFAKGVQSVETADELTTNWKAKVFLSNRSWKGSVTEQIPDKRIVWTSEGAKGTTKGVVTFHALGENLTKVLLLVEYYPKGLFEKTGNIWRAQGRRLRLDLKHYRRFIMTRGEATGAWRGEIRDGEVVREHDDVVAEEEAEQEQGAGVDDEPRDEDDAVAEDEELEEEPAEDEPVDDEPVDEDEDERPRRARSRS
ncbi:MAG TPA: SRPBCC family protein [Streptosporangiaceae bacterium]|jgi:uncharacterized membrane protein